MISTDKLKADEPLRSKHNRARLHHSYDLGSDAENLSDHDNGWGFRRAYDHERTIANGFSAVPGKAAPRVILPKATGDPR